MIGVNRALAEYNQPNCLVDPVSLAASGNTTSRYINLADVLHASIIIQTGVGTSSGCTITLKQALDTGGTSSKSLAFTEYWYCADVTSTTAGDIWVRTAATTMSTLVTKNAVIFEIFPPMLDVANSFGCVAFNIVNNDGANALIYSAVATMVTRHEGSNIMPCTR